MNRKFKTFAELHAAEEAQLQEAGDSRGGAATPPPAGDFVSPEGVSGEPWVQTAQTDRVGLALSGGGIRSAIFNLGLLQALDQRGVLRLVDYLSTVSGGGYIGGFWTAWRQRTPVPPPGGSVFPHHCSTDGRDPGKGDSREEPSTRHLREFSRFLIPRIGLNEPEMWFALATIIGGMLPALLTTLAAVGVALFALLALGWLAGRDGHQHQAAYVFAAATLILHAVRSDSWRKTRREEPMTNRLSWGLVYWAGALATTGLGASLIPRFKGSQSAVLDWLKISWGWEHAGSYWRFTTFTFQPALIWLILALFVSTGWMLVEMFCRGWEFAAANRKDERDYRAAQEKWKTQGGLAPENPDERWQRQKHSWERLNRNRARRLRRATIRDLLASRYLAWGAFAAGLGGIWEVSFWLHDSLVLKAHPEQTTGGLAAVFTGLYIWLREWLTKPDKQTTERGFWQKLAQGIKPLLPMAAATCGALLLVIFAIMLMRDYGMGAPPESNDGKAPHSAAAWAAMQWTAIALAAICAIAWKLFDPAYFGLHDFYRSRIARAFLGAAYAGLEAPEKSQRSKEELRARELREEARICREEIEACARKVEEADEKAVHALRNELIKKREQFGRIQDTAERLELHLRGKLEACDNEYTVVRISDDFCLDSLPDSQAALKGVSDPGLLSLRLRPVHLICCAANHLSGDVLPTLSRGARSAVLSQRGISIGDDCCLPRNFDPQLMLSAAQTASAAAFNSQMGEKSLRLGPAGSFIMTALNLRLGLWVVNPAHERQAFDDFSALIARRKKERRELKSPLARVWHFSWRWIIRLRIRASRNNLLRAIFALPGSAFFLELIGHSSALPADNERRLHLSDGGHFENLGLYELIRRHVRYALVSDAGQDEEVAFDDLGNAIRRVREDFNVEIEIDLAPLRPNEHRISAQHMVVGTIHYDGFEGSDKGVLLYFKPTLTGDESGDIQQYRRRNRVFPHEPTSDQFYSEAQWESYRRLGEHIGQTTFACLDALSAARRNAAESVFRHVRSAWRGLPAGFDTAMSEITARFADLDTSVRSEAPSSFQAELWPEPAGLAQSATPAAPSADATAEFVLLTKALGVMEEAWRTLQLDDYRLHPANLGIMNRMRRWWRTPTLRQWWIFLSSFCSDGFREFVQANFQTAVPDGTAGAGSANACFDLKLVDHPRSSPNPLAWNLWPAPRPEIKPGENRVVEYRLRLGSPNDHPRFIQVGILVHTLENNVASWEGQNFFVPPMLSGAGIKSRFLDRILDECKRLAVSIVVHVPDPFPGQLHPTARQTRLQLIDFYRSRNFTLDSKAKDGFFATVRRLH